MASFRSLTARIFLCEKIENRRFFSGRAGNLILMKQSAQDKLSNWIHQYEDFIGLSDVKDAQNKVIQAEKKFLEAQDKRRARQQQIQEIQIQLKAIHTELDKTSRGEDGYLNLITEEHTVVKKEKQLLEDFGVLEKAERDYFSALSLALRESHEKERAQAEQTKYWSIIGSVFGAVIGIVGTSISSHMHTRELKEVVQETSGKSKVHSLVSELMNVMQSQHHQMVLFVADLKNVLGFKGTQPNLISSNVSFKTDLEIPFEKLEAQTNEILSFVQKQDSCLAKEMNDIKALVKSLKVSSHIQTDKDREVSPSVLYVGEDVGKLMTNTQQNLEWKMKINSLSTVVFVYATLAVTVPVMMYFFRGV